MRKLRVVEVREIELCSERVCDPDAYFNEGQGLYIVTEYNDGVIVKGFKLVAVFKQRGVLRCIMLDKKLRIEDMFDSCIHDSEAKFHLKILNKKPLWKRILEVIRY